MFHWASAACFEKAVPWFSVNQKWRPIWAEGTSDTVHGRSLLILSAAAIKTPVPSQVCCVVLFRERERLRQRWRTIREYNKKDLRTKIVDLLPLLEERKTESPSISFSLLRVDIHSVYISSSLHNWKPVDYANESSCRREFLNFLIDGRRSPKYIYFSCRLTKMETPKLVSDETNFGSESHAYSEPKFESETLMCMEQSLESPTRLVSTERCLESASPEYSEEQCSQPVTLAFQKSEPASIVCKELGSELNTIVSTERVFEPASFVGTEQALELALIHYTDQTIDSPSENRKPSEEGRISVRSQAGSSVASFPGWWLKKWSSSRVLMCRSLPPEIWECWKMIECFETFLPPRISAPLTPSHISCFRKILSRLWGELFRCGCSRFVIKSINILLHIFNTFLVI